MCNLRITSLLSNQELFIQSFLFNILLILLYFHSLYFILIILNTLLSYLLQGLTGLSRIDWSFVVWCEINSQFLFLLILVLGILVSKGIPISVPYHNLKSWSHFIFIWDFSRVSSKYISFSHIQWFSCTIRYS